MMNENYTHILYFSGCPEFFGSLEECEIELSKRATSDRMKRFFQIRSRESAEEKATAKLLVDQSMSKTHSSPEYDRFGDVVYYK
jgi:hypothetical protein